MNNSPEIKKSKFISQYWGTKTLCTLDHNSLEVGTGEWYLDHPGYFLELKPLSSITDDEIKEVCKMAHNLSIQSKFNIVNDTSFEIDRRSDSIHCSYIRSNINARHHICLNYTYATINSNLHFDKTEYEDGSSHKINIAEIHHSSSMVVGYIQVLDYLRWRGYALPFMNYSVNDLVKMKWIKLV